MYLDSGDWRSGTVCGSKTLMRIHLIARNIITVQYFYIRKTPSTRYKGFLVCRRHADRRNNVRLSAQKNADRNEGN